MCLSIPYKVLSVKDNKAKIKFQNKLKEVDSSLVKVKIGDYVISQNNVIIKKIDKKEVNELLKLLGGKII